MTGSGPAASPRTRTSRRIGIRVQLSVMFSAAMLLVAALLLGVGYVQAERYLVEFATRQMGLTRTMVAESTRRYLRPAALSVEVLGAAGLFEVPPDERAEQFFPLAEMFLDRYPEISTSFAGFTDGSYLRTGRTTPAVSRLAGLPEQQEPPRLRGHLYPIATGAAHGSEWFYLDEVGNWVGSVGLPTDFDPRERPWYGEAVAAEGIDWSGLFAWKSGIVGIVAAQAHRNGSGELAGVVGVGLEFGQLGRFLDSIAVSANSVAFIARADGHVLAHPEFADLPGLGDAADSSARTAPSLAEDAYRDSHPLEHALFARIAPSSAVETFRLQGRRYIGVASRIPGQAGLDASVYVGAPVADFVGFAVRAHLRALVLAALLVAAAVLVGFRVAGQIAAPVERLSSLATSVERDGLERVADHPGSFIPEIDEAGTAFNGMIAGLRERELIRKLFGQYVPEEVAAEIIRREGALEPVVVECSILFVDLEGFTALAEGLSPTELVDALNEFFGAATEIIERNGGVVTQFQGDAILAIFNVPVPRSDHAARAVASALELERTCESRIFAGRRLAIRAGVNTGTVVAGNVGAIGRLHYTVHGDAVNVAARLEQLNKRFGTRVLVSEATRQACPALSFSPIGELEVRGKRAPVAVYAVHGSHASD